MKFNQDVIFLGINKRTGQKGVSYSVDMYVPGGEPWNFFLRDNDDNYYVIQTLMNTACGTKLTASFQLGSYNNQVYVRLIGISDDV